MSPDDRQITYDCRGHILTNTNVWSPDGQWIVYDTRSDPSGASFDGNEIAMVHVETGEIKTLYNSRDGAHCGVVTFHPRHNRVAFILGPTNPTADWQYGPAHRQGILLDLDVSSEGDPIDARDLRPPRTPGALRGGSHVHIFCPAGDWLSFTYNDALLPPHDAPLPGYETDARNVAVAVPLAIPLHVPADHARNHDGAFFTFLATRTNDRPRPGSDDIMLAQEEGWIGVDGYRRADGTRQRRALAFQGTVVAPDGSKIAEVFVVDLPEEPTRPSPDGPLEGTPTRRPLPPLGTAQRRVTQTEHRRFTGIQGARHWLRSSPDGSQIATLLRDDQGVVQIWTVSPNGGSSLRQVTQDPWDVVSAFTWSPNGHCIAYIADRSVFTVDVISGESHRRTSFAAQEADAPLPLACVFSPDGRRIAYLRSVGAAPDAPGRYNQIFVVTLPDGDIAGAKPN